MYGTLNVERLINFIRHGSTNTKKLAETTINHFRRRKKNETDNVDQSENSMSSLC